MRRFDHNFCLDGTGFRKVAEAYEPDSGRVMEAFTDMPGMQLYLSLIHISEPTRPY